MRIGGGGTGTMIKSDCNATQRDGDYEDKDKGGGQPQQGGPPQGGKICKECKGKEEGFASVEEVRRAAVQVHNDDAAFLLSAEATVATTTALVGNSNFWFQFLGPPS
jgi:hypothetical protein